MLLYIGLSIVITLTSSIKSEEDPGDGFKHCHIVVVKLNQTTENKFAEVLDLKWQEIPIVRFKQNSVSLKTQFSKNLNGLHGKRLVKFYTP